MSSPVPTGGPLENPVLRAMLEAGGVWLWDSDLVQEISKYQDGFWEQYGYDGTRFTETFDFIHVVHTSDLAELSRAWRAHLEGETPAYAAEWRLRTAEGDWRWIRSRGKVIERNEHGRALRMVGAYTDITDMRRSQLGLADSTAEMDAVFRNSRDGIALIGPDLRLMRANEAVVDIVERFTGYRPFEGNSILDIPSFNPDRPIIQDIKLALGGARSLPERLASSPDGSRWLEASYSPVFKEDGSILGVAVGLRDVTEKKRMEQTRMHALRLESMGLLAGGIAHDFNNLLAAIMGNIDLARMGTLDDETRTGLDEAHDAARRASELVRDLLAFAGKQSPVVRHVELSALTREMVRYARKIPGNSSEVLEEFAEGLPEIEADGTQVRQIALNLVVNALEASRGSGGAVSVRTFEQPAPLDVRAVLEPQAAARYVALEVKDDGVGMDQDTLDHIWDPFFTTKETGHGLGLPSVLGAVRSHGGTLAVESEPGRGATFTVYFPAIE